MNPSLLPLVASIVIPIISMIMVLVFQIKNWKNLEHDKAVKIENRMTRLETKLEGVSTTLNRLERRR